jgi:hypothetical protein
MSLDFILIKSHGHPLSIEEIEMDAQFGIGDYKNLAERFFGPVVWSAGTGIATHGDMSFELTPHDISLSVTVRGHEDKVAYIGNVAALAIKEGIVTIDVQVSELILPLSD